MLREHLYNFYTQHVHISSVNNLLGAYSNSINDAYNNKLALFGCASASSVRVLIDLSSVLIYTFSTIFEIIEKLHKTEIATDGDYMPYLHAIRLPYKQLLLNIIKYENNLDYWTGESSLVE